MARSFKDFCDRQVSVDKKVKHSIKELDEKNSKRIAKYFIDEDLEDTVEDIPLDEETYKKYIKN